MPWASILLRAGAFDKETNSRYAARADANVSGIPRRARAIDDMSVANHQIVGLLRERNGKGG